MGIVRHSELLIGEHRELTSIAPSSRLAAALSVILPTTIILACAVASVAVWEWWLPNRRIQDIDYLSHADPAELRSTAHKVLRLSGGNDHDACLVLMGVGDRSSIPCLQSAIQRSRPHEGVVECTNTHCQDALARARATHP